MQQVLVRLRSVRETFWIVPAASIVLAAIIGVLVPALDRAVTVPD